MYAIIHRDGKLIGLFLNRLFVLLLLPLHGLCDLGRANAQFFCRLFIWCGITQIDLIRVIAAHRVAIGRTLNIEFVKLLFILFLLLTYLRTVPVFLRFLDVLST